MAIAATSLGINNIIHGGAAAMLAQNPEMLNRLGLPDGFKHVLSASFRYAAEKEEAKEQTILVSRI